MVDIVYLTLLGMKILKERFSGSKTEWKMIEFKAYTFLKRKHLLDVLAVDRLIETMEVTYK